jgi:N-acetyl-alpha-D-muramate 1-phosphate uridylyltransferase
MRAMILAAGKGTRLAPLTHSTPKPLLPLAGKPLIEWQIEALTQAGVNEIVINLHHLGNQIRDHLGNGERFGVHIQYSPEPELLETGGGIVNALPLLQHEPFWLLNGDIWTDFDFTQLPTAPRPPNQAHLVLTPTPSSRETGDFEIAGGQITQRGNSYVYCGIAVLTPKLFEGVDVAHFSLRELYFALIAQNRISAQIHAGVWHDIGTLEEYRSLQQTLQEADQQI